MEAPRRLLEGDACFECARAVDPRTAAARIVDGRVVKVCRACVGGGEHRAAPRRSRTRCCCGDEMDVTKAQPIVGSSGVELVCPPCAIDPSRAERVRRAAAVPVPSEAERPARRTRRSPLVFLGGAALVAVAGAIVLWSNAGATASLAPSKVPGGGEVTVGEAVASKLLSVDVGDIKWLYIPPPPSVPERAKSSKAGASLAIPGGEEWVHPIPETEEMAPDRGSRRFGAERPGKRPGECGAGHCGVDLGGPRGSPVVAVAEGIVQRVERARGGASGKYVRILHPGGAETFYMHLDDVVDGIERGAPVKAGELIGSLGRTGIQNSAPHLHFAVTVPNHGGWWRSSRYVDPGPALARAKVVSLLDLHINDREPVAPVKPPQRRAQNAPNGADGEEEARSSEEASADASPPQAESAKEAGDEADEPESRGAAKADASSGRNVRQVAARKR